MKLIATGKVTGLTIVETIIGITLLAVIVGSILGVFEVIHRYFKNGIALINAQSEARMVVEKMARPVIREGRSFGPPPANGNTLTITRYNGASITYTFNNGDGSDATFADNTIKESGNTIGTHIVKIPGVDVFETVAGSSKLVAVNFGIKYEGISGEYKEVRVRTVLKLRN